MITFTTFTTYQKRITLVIMLISSVAVLVIRRISKPIEKWNTKVSFIQKSSFSLFIPSAQDNYHCKLYQLDHYWNGIDYL